MKCVYCLKEASNVCPARGRPCRTVESFRVARGSPKEVIDHLIDDAQSLDMGMSPADLLAALDRVNRECE